MSSIVCTLFEGSYHYGVAALANSLYIQGFKGEFYAGYRGSLPNWCSIAQSNTSISWQNAKTIQISNQFNIHFLPLDTDYHFTNYKPDFMLRLWDGPAKHDSAMFYFDPDIIVTHKWSFFEEWIRHGVALCEDVNSPLPCNHPRRMAWREYYGKNNILLNYKEIFYANGGFVGVSNMNRDFIEIWKNLQEIMAPLFGGLSRSSFKGTSFAEDFSDYYYPFSKTDQDALNATIETFEGDLSFIGQEAMAFKSGMALLPHALGENKPWNTNFIGQLLKGHRPRLVDREYWKAASKGPIAFHSSICIRRKLTAIKFSAFIGRFYNR